MVKGKNINFSARAINSLFGTLSIDTPRELQEFLEGHPPLDTICKVICRDDPQWTLSRLNEPIHFSRSKLTFAADNVTKERAVMIFAILTDIPFDIGHFLYKSIWKNAMGGLTIGLYHPSLITELCAHAGLERQLGLEERVDRLADEVHHLQLQQEQQFAYQQQWWALWADQMHIPMNNRPRYPPDEPAEPPPADMGDA
ncbi:hypothetical protein CDL12_17722 [Handroanthus impetiginosus]|uniref:Putative plant transposon protein domain-containing protein n=1 Tax=Handroanthus impetiginosus TaxID=429701 RepID=A0A2G9GWN6_9LAMI|nr:hypothetical protein CDL12_17722 [Handroanthus impetiginosus]